MVIIHINLIGAKHEKNGVCNFILYVICLLFKKKLK